MRSAMSWRFDPKERQKYRVVRNAPTVGNGLRTAEF